MPREEMGIHATIQAWRKKQRHGRAKFCRGRRRKRDMGDRLDFDDPLEIILDLEKDDPMRPLFVKLCEAHPRMRLTDGLPDHVVIVREGRQRGIYTDPSPWPRLVITSDLSFYVPARTRQEG